MRQMLAYGEAQWQPGPRLKKPETRVLGSNPARQTLSEFLLGE